VSGDDWRRQSFLLHRFAPLAIFATLASLQRSQSCGYSHQIRLATQNALRSAFGASRFFVSSSTNYQMATVEQRVDHYDLTKDIIEDFLSEIFEECSTSDFDVKVSLPRAISISLC